VRRHPAKIEAALRRKLICDIRFRVGVEGPGLDGGKRPRVSSAYDEQLEPFLVFIKMT